MAFPTSAPATLRPELSAMLQEWPGEMQEQGMIAARVAPVITVMAQSGIFGKMDREEMLKGGHTRRAPGSTYERIDQKFTTDSFATEEHGLEGTVDDRRRALYANFLQPDINMTKSLNWELQRQFEVRVRTAAFAALSATNVSTWDDAANGTPLTDLVTAKKKIHAATGLVPNQMVFPYATLQDLLLSDEVIDRMSGQGFHDVALQPLEAQLQGLSAIFGLEVIVSGSLLNTADEGLAASLASIWTAERVLISHVDKTGNMDAPTFMRTFQWLGDGMSADSMTVESYREEPRRGDTIRVRHESDEVVVMAEAGELLDIS